MSGVIPSQIELIVPAQFPSEVILHSVPSEVIAKSAQHKRRNALWKAMYSLQKLSVMVNMGVQRRSGMAWHSRLAQTLAPYTAHAGAAKHWCM